MGLEGQKNRLLFFLLSGPIFLLAEFVEGVLGARPGATGAVS
jgi:hypothetical protein